MDIVKEITSRIIKLEQANIKPSFIYLGIEQRMRLKKYLMEAFNFNYINGTEFEGVEIIEVDRTSHLNVG